MNYLIYGLGKSGISSANYLSQNNNVVVSDDNFDNINKDLLNNNITITHSDKINYANIDKVIFAPGIPLHHPNKHKILKLQQQYNFELICDVEEFYQLNHNNNFIGITGTNGKSTTTALLGHIFDNLNIKNNIGGNIGINSFDLEQNKINHTYIFECSSYQLDLSNKLKFDIACLTNISPDHLDRHGTMANYCQAKKRIFNNQTTNDYQIINIDNNFCREIYDQLKIQNNAKILPFSTTNILPNGLSYIGNKITIKTNVIKDEINFNHQYLKGLHNKENILCALAITIAFHQQKNLDINLKKIIDIIATFKGLKHRQEFVKTLENINFINDSKATNSESTKTALKSYDNIYLILGGKKKDDLEVIIDDLKIVKKIFLIGESQNDFAEILTKNSIAFEKNKELNIALKNAYDQALKNNKTDQINILFSPACSSFDQFKNFEERGSYFCKLVNEL